MSNSSSTVISECYFDLRLFFSFFFLESRDPTNFHTVSFFFTKIFHIASCFFHLHFFQNKRKTICSPGKKENLATYIFPDRENNKIPKNVSFFLLLKSLAAVCRSRLRCQVIDFIATNKQRSRPAGGFTKRARFCFVQSRGQH
jgi:hypothetical protein